MCQLDATCRLDIFYNSAASQCISIVVKNLRIYVIDVCCFRFIRFILFKLSALNLILYYTHIRNSYILPRDNLLVVFPVISLIKTSCYIRSRGNVSVDRNVPTARYIQLAC